MRFFITILIIILPIFLVGQITDVEKKLSEIENFEQLNAGLLRKSILNSIDSSRLDTIGKKNKFIPDTIPAFFNNNSIKFLLNHCLVDSALTELKSRNLPTRFKEIAVSEIYAEASHNYLKTRINNDRIEHTNLSSLRIGFPSSNSKLPFSVEIDVKRLNGEFNLALSTIDLKLNPPKYLDNLIQGRRAKFEEGLPNLSDFNSYNIDSENAGRKEQILDKFKKSKDAIDFDQQKGALKQKVGEKAKGLMGNSMNEEWPNKFYALKDLSPDELKVWKKELEFSTIKKIIDHPNFKPLIDSIRMDTIMNERLATYKKELYGAQFRIEEYKNSLNQLDSIDQKIYLDHALKSQGIDTLLTKYHMVWKERSTYYGDSLNQIKESWKNKGLLLMDPEVSKDSLKQYLTDNQLITKFQKIVSNFEQLSIGQGNLNEHWLVAKYLNFNGLQFAYRQDKLLVSSAVGRQRFNFSFLPFLGSGLNFNRNDKDLFFAKINYELNQNNDIGFSFLGIKENQSQNAALAIFPERSNQVFSFNSRSNLTSCTEVLLQISYSLTKAINADFQESFADNKIPNFAGEIRLRQGFGTFPLSLDVGFFQVGENYLTLGNPFLRRGRAGYLVGLSGQVLDWLNLNFEVRKEKSINQTSQLSAKINELTAIGIVRVTPTKNVSINASAFPSQIKYDLLGDNQDGYNLWNYALTVDHQIVNENLIFHNSIGFTNSLSEINLAELESSQNIFSLNYSGQLLLDKKHIISALGSRWFDFGSNAEQNLSEIGIVKCNYEYVAGKMAVKVGLQSNIYFKEKAQDIGIDCGIGYALNSRLNFSIDAYLPQLIKDANLPITWTQEYITTRFIYRPQQK